MAKKSSKCRHRQDSPFATRSRKAKRPELSRSLHFENLEQRQLLATLTVDSLSDVSNAGDGLTTLREAVVAANNTVGADTIVFDSSLSGGEIDLVQGELVISETLTIDASPLAANIVIDAQQQSRVINFTSYSGDLSLGGLTLKNGLTTGFDEDGGGIHIRSFGTLTLTESIVSGNSVTGERSEGGGIFAYVGAVTLTDSTVSGNSTAGDSGNGGGILSAAGAVTLTNSTVSGNSTSGYVAQGGGWNSPRKVDSESVLTTG